MDQAEAPLGKNNVSINIQLKTTWLLNSESSSSQAKQFKENNRISTWRPVTEWKLLLKPTTVTFLDKLQTEGNGVHQRVHEEGSSKRNSGSEQKKQWQRIQGMWITN